MSGTMDDRGRDYVARWPQGLGRRFKMSADHLPRAMRRAGIIAEGDEGRLRTAFAGQEYAAEVGALTPDAARAVIAEFVAIRAEIRARARTHCQGCGLPLITSGDCRECV